MVACLHVVFQTCMEQFYLRFCVHVLYFNWTQNRRNKQTAVDVKHWNEARQLMWHLLHPDARRLGVHVVFFWFVAECKTQTDKRQLMSLKQTRDASTVDVEHRTVCVVFLVFAFKHGEREFTAKMSQHMFWRATSKMSERKTSGDTAGNLSGFVLGRTLFFLLVCVWGLETVSTN